MKTLGAHVLQRTFGEMLTRPIPCLWQIRKQVPGGTFLSILVLTPLGLVD